MNEGDKSFSALKVSNRILKVDVLKQVTNVDLLNRCNVIILVGHAY